jgi:hypothetical protein
MQDAIEQVPDWLFTMDALELRAHFQKQAEERGLKSGWLPSLTDERLRNAFWAEYEASFKLNQGMQMSRVYAGVCSKQCFYESVIKNPARVAWMLCPPTHYMNAMEEALLFGVDQMREILALPHVGKSGLIDSKLCSVKVEIVKMLDARVKGAVVQKTQAVNVNVKAEDVEQVKSMVQGPNNMDEIDRRLRELEQESKQLEVPASHMQVGKVTLHNRDVIETTHRDVTGDEEKTKAPDSAGEGDVGP